MITRIRTVIYVLSALIALSIYIIVRQQFTVFDLQVIRLVQYYAFSAVILLYLTMLCSPLYVTFPNLPGKALYGIARQALGVSAFFFGLLHGGFAFFISLGGFAGLGFLSNKFLLAIILSATALLTLGILALISLSYFTKKFGPRLWVLYRLTYLAGLFVLIHALLLGTHFLDLSRNLPQIFFFMLLLLLILEAVRLDTFVVEKFSHARRFSIVFVMVMVLLTMASVYVFFPGGDALSVGIHAKHLQRAREAAQNSAAVARFNVDFTSSANIGPNKNTELRFLVTNARTGEPVTAFDIVQEKLLHLIVVNSSLDYFSHIHPELKNGEFVVTTKFPEKAVYRLYLDFQPTGSPEQQFAFILPVGGASAVMVPTIQSDVLLTKTFGDYQVTLKEDTFRAADMSLGQQELVLSVRDTAGDPVTSLQPYLGAFGHLVMIRATSYDYIHVHPVRPIPVSSFDQAGPDVTFVPLGLSGPIEPGVYRLFAQFNLNGEIVVADFAIRVE